LNIKDLLAGRIRMTHEIFYCEEKELEDEILVRFDGQRVEIVNRCQLEESVE
jgi:hypothetical protein